MGSRLLCVTGGDFHLPSILMVMPILLVHMIVRLRFNTVGISRNDLQYPFLHHDEEKQGYYVDKAIIIAFQVVREECISKK